MVMFKRTYCGILWSLGVLSLASCTAITNPGQYEVGVTCPAVEEGDLQVELFSFELYEDERIEIRILRDGAFVMRAVLDGIDEEGTGPDNPDDASLLCLTFPDVAEVAGNYEVRTFVDSIRNDAPDFGDEPTWVDQVFDGLASVDGEEVSSGFDPLPSAELPPGDLVLRLTGMNPHVVGTQHFAVMILELDDTVVGFMRLPNVTAVGFDLAIHGILQPNTMYKIEMYADLEENGVYDPPDPSIPPDMLTIDDFPDHSWITQFQSDGDGNADHAFPHDTNFVLLPSFDP